MESKNKELTEKEIQELEKGPTKDIHPYKKDGIFGKIPFSLKALFMKWWFFGCGFFFIFWGLSNVMGGDSTPQGEYLIILIFVLALFNGVVTDCIVDHIIDLMDDNTNKRRYFVLFHNKKFYSLFINVGYSIILTTIVVLIFEFLGSLNLFDYGLEPITVGLVKLVVDMIFISINNLIICLVKKLKGENKNV